MNATFQILRVQHHKLADAILLRNYLQEKARHAHLPGPVNLSAATPSGAPEHYQLVRRGAHSHAAARALSVGNGNGPASTTFPRRRLVREIPPAISAETGSVAALRVIGRAGYGVGSSLAAVGLAVKVTGAHLGGVTIRV
jgi:hypothetical protein